MPYSERQLRRLAAMGLVAWQARVVASPSGPPAAPFGTAFATSSETRPAASAAPSGSPPPTRPEISPAPAPEPSREPAPASPTGRPLDAAPVAALAPELAPVDAPVPLATPLPRDPRALGDWLPSQPLAPFRYRDRTITRIGRDDAPLLIVVERAAAAETPPLVGDAAELFERMLRAIGLTRRDTCQCALASAPHPDGENVATLAAMPHRAALVLVQELDDGLDERGCRLHAGGADVPAALALAWCLPHPERLLVEPLRKRQAWLVLKTLGRHLAGHP